MGHQSSKQGLKNNLRLWIKSDMHTKTVGRIEKTVGDERSNFLTHKEALSMDPSLHRWPKTKKQGPDTKDIPEDRDIGTVRVKCSSLFQR